MSYKNRWKDITTSGWINDSNIYKINICLVLITLTTIIVKYWSFKPPNLFWEYLKAWYKGLFLSKKNIVNLFEDIFSVLWK